MTDKEKHPNWVECKAAREANLKDGAEEVWQNIRSAAQDCCESFRKHYNSNIKDALENGVRIRLIVPYSTGQKQTILVAFNQLAATIEVTIGKSLTKAYHIDADETHAFVTDDNRREISADEFTRIALESALTKPPIGAETYGTRPVKNHPF